MIVWSDEGVKRLACEVLKVAVNNFWKGCDKINNRKIKNYNHTSKKSTRSKQAKNFSELLDELYSIDDVWFQASGIDRDWFYENMEKQITKRYGNKVEEWI